MTDEAISDFVDDLLKDMDPDKDGQISYAEYKTFSGYKS